MHTYVLNRSSTSSLLPILISLITNTLTIMWINYYLEDGPEFGPHAFVHDGFIPSIGDHVTFRLDLESAKKENTILIKDGFEERFRNKCFLVVERFTFAGDASPIQCTIRERVDKKKRN